MPFYEIVYEPGRMSVAEYADDEEAKAAIKGHNDRAVRGEIGGPPGANWPAERISAVYVYDKHPDAYRHDQTASADVAEKEVGDLIKRMKDDNGVVSIDRLALAVRDMAHPMLQGMDRKGTHGSMYKMKEQRQLNLKFLEGASE